MAAVTWGTKVQPQVIIPTYTPVSCSQMPAARDDDDLRSVESNSLMSPPSMLQRFRWRYVMPLNAALELLLLLLVGVSSTVTAFVVDKSIEFLSAARAHAAQEGTTFFTSYAIWTGSALILCSLSVAVVQYIGPSAAGSGIPQMKCVLAGVHIHHYLSFPTLVAKAVSLVLALAGGLSIGKEGPYVHMSSCTAHLLCSLKPFRSIGSHEHLRRQVLAAGCAAGVSATFGAPVGGVLFSIEVTSTYYSISHLWKAMFTAVCGSMMFHVTRDFGDLALFQLTNFNVDMGRALYNGEMVAFAFLGVLCGLMGAAFVHATSSLVLFIRELRKPPAAPVSMWGSHYFMSLILSRYGYTLVVAFTSAMLTFPFGFFRSSPEDVINELFGAAPFDFSARWANPSLFVNLSIYAVCKFVFTVIAVGCPISCGVFTPVFLIGAAAGRCFGEVYNVFMPPELQVTAGGYAVVGAAAMAAGVTRTVSCAVMVFELTGQLNHMLPVLVAVLAAYGVGNMLNNSIYDTMLELNNLPYLKPPQLLEDSKRTACDVMDRDALALTCRPTYGDVYLILQQSDDDEFAVLDESSDRILVGSVRRTALQRIVDDQLHGPQPRLGRLERWSHLFKRKRDKWSQVRGGMKAVRQLAAIAKNVKEYKPDAAASTPSSNAPAETCPSSRAADHRAMTPATPHSICVPEATRPPAPPGSGTSSSEDCVETVCSSANNHDISRQVRREPELSRTEETAGDSQPGAESPGSLELTASEIDLLQTPLDLGIDRQEILNWGAMNHPPPSKGLINFAPNVIVAGTPLQQVHMQFSLLGIERAYVTFGGRLQGVIRRSNLSASSSR